MISGRNIEFCLFFSENSENITGMDFFAFISILMHWEREKYFSNHLHGYYRW